LRDASLPGCRSTFMGRQLRYHLLAANRRQSYLLSSNYR
jgi:hypothetical protein